jgi:hypothetical protein
MRIILRIGLFIEQFLWEMPTEKDYIGFFINRKEHLLNALV